MNDESKQPNPPNDQAQGETSETPQYREISQKELDRILEDHRQWLQSEDFKKWATAPEEETKKYTHGRANLSSCNLQKAELEEADLRYADLQGVMLSSPYLGSVDPNIDFGANLKKSNLIGVQLQGALIRGVNLQGADLSDANMEEADLCYANLQGATLRRTNLSKASLSKVKGLEEAILQDVNLEGATGLKGNEFARTDVTGARLPEKIEKFDGLIQVEEISKKAGKLFISMLLGCVYAWLTIATTTDVGLLTNSSSSPLPIIQAKIPIAGFYWAGPLILFAIYVWFHFYLQRYWEGLAELPAVFPDGKPLDKKAYPWLLNSLVRPNFTLLRKNRPPLSQLMVGISIVLAWWVVPLTFIPFWLRYLPRHEWVGTGLHITLLVLATVCTIRFQHLAKLTLRGQQREPLRFRANWKFIKTYRESLKRTWKITGAGLATLLLAFVVSDGAIKGFEIDDQSKKENADVKENPPSEVERFKVWYREAIPAALPYIGARAFADFTEKDVSTKPPNWFSQKEEDLPRIVNGAQLRKANLRFLSARSAFLLNANLRGANLEQANLRRANLKGADLRGANLTKADLNRANLNRADLREANLTKVDLHSADLYRANLANAHLEQAYMSFAYLKQAHLYQAHLERAFLANAHLEQATLQKAHLEHAFLWNIHLERADLREAHLEQADLANAHLERADLREAHLEQANLANAHLERADLREASLGGVKNLTQAQLDQACVDETTKLPKGLTLPAPCPEEEKVEEAK